MTTIRTATTDDAPAAAELYGRGGLDEAVISWVIPDDAARRRHAAERRDQTVAWLAGTIASGEVVLAVEDDGTVVGVAVWERLDGQPPALGSAELAAFLEQAYGPYAPRMAQVTEAVAARHPHGVAHWYLQQVVVDAACRGRGVGGALIRAHLAHVDAERLPAYLEASTPRNQRLYERLGFHPSGDPVVFAADGPRLQPMWRPVCG